MTATANDINGIVPDGAFYRIVELVISCSALQKKKILQDLRERNAAFFIDAEAFAQSYYGYLKHHDIPLEYAVEAYLEMCRNMMKCQVEFMKTGCYRIHEPARAIYEVYGNENRMKSYMIGLAISQFLWRTHYEMYCCLRKALKRYCRSARSYLEIGPGHGLFLKEAVKLLPGDASIKVVDISKVSIDITRSIMGYFYPEVASIEYITGDVLLIDSSDQYDFITMGEVLEHVKNPDMLMQKLHSMLKVDGRAFVSTCVNAPAIDHVYQFHHVDEIRSLLKKCGFIIDEELVLPVENLPMSDIIAGKITVNYCAILKRKSA